MGDWSIWVIVAAALAVGEILTLGFFLGPIAIAAAITAIVAAAGAGVAVQLIVFAIASAASLGALRPVARRHARSPAHLSTGTAALVGREAVVIERIDGAGGQVKLAGEVWTARAFDDDEVLEAGTKVQVFEIKGATALVSDATD